jgi:2-keto-4-pentenoate hydratase/2-oxohepta-3-ene-1,7-dioic acid hydratase in catechol pathway
VSYLSHCCTLEPGDVILTGTPAGVILGKPEDEQDWLQAGDVLTVREDTIGELTVTMRA